MHNKTTPNNSTQNESKYFQKINTRKSISDSDSSFNSIYFNGNGE